MTTRLGGAVLKKIKIAHGPVAGSGESMAAESRRISTGSVTLDYALGGGVRVGMITMFYGEKSGGKTTSAIRTCGIAQKACRNCFRPAARDAWEVPESIMPMTRIAAHDELVGRGYQLAATYGRNAYYHSDDPSAEPVIIRRMPGGVEAVPPTAEDLAEDEDSRWSSRGYCSCFAEGIYKLPVPAQESGEKKKEYEARVERWRTELTLNSYDEVVIVWMDMEGAIEKDWTAKVGLDLRRVFFIRATNAEEAIDIGHAIALTGQVDLWVIDSIAQLVPQKELTASMEEWQQGLQARLVNKAARKIVSSQNVSLNAKRPLTQIWINQAREKIGVMWGDPTVKPGGKGQEFAIHAEIKFLKSKVEKLEDQYGTKNETLSVPLRETISFKTTKNRTQATLGVEWSYIQLMRANDVAPAGAVVEDELIFKLAMRHLIKQDTKKGTYTMGNLVFDSQKELMVKIREDSDFCATVRSLLLTHIINAPASSFTGKEAGE